VYTNTSLGNDCEPQPHDADVFRMPRQRPETGAKDSRAVARERWGAEHRLWVVRGESTAERRTYGAAFAGQPATSDF